MKPASKMLFTATMIALGSIYGCGSGDDTSIDIDVEGSNNGGGSVVGDPSTCPTWASSRPIDADGNDVCQLPANILVDRELTSDIVWFLDSRVTVGNGNQQMSTTEGTLENGDAVLNVTLEIEAGTQLKGGQDSDANLVITRGSRIEAIGTAADPIVFSSEDDDFFGPGEWGGLILQGYGPHNLCPQADAGSVACNVDSEGDSGFAGGYTQNDNSGILRYVVVTEGGFIIAGGNEINGITFIGVGSDTEVEYIQVNDNADDGVEFFGSNVSAKYVVLTNSLDDTLDFDEGYSGNLQYLLAVQREDAPGNIIEGSSNDGSVNFISKPTIANATFVGGGSNNDLWQFKENVGTFMLNSIGVPGENADFDGGTPPSPYYCVFIADAATAANIDIELVFNNVIDGCDDFSDDTNADPLAASGVIMVDPNLDANYRAQDPAASGADIDVAGFNATYVESTADETYLDDTDYIGAIAPDATSCWWDGWVIEGSVNDCTL